MVHALADLLARLPSRRAHAARLLPLLLSSLSDEVEQIQKHAAVALERLGDLFAAEAEAEEPPRLQEDASSGGDLAAAGTAAAESMDVSEGADAAAATAAGSSAAASKLKGGAAAAEAAAAAAAAVARVAPKMLSGTLFASSPKPSAAALVASELKPILPPLVKDIADWTKERALLSMSANDAGRVGLVA